MLRNILFKFHVILSYVVYLKSASFNTLFLQIAAFGKISTCTVRFSLYVQPIFLQQKKDGRSRPFPPPLHISSCRKSFYSPIVPVILLSRIRTSPLRPYHRKSLRNSYTLWKHPAYRSSYPAGLPHLLRTRLPASGFRLCRTGSCRR